MGEKDQKEIFKVDQGIIVLSLTLVGAKVPAQIKGITVKVPLPVVIDDTNMTQVAVVLKGIIQRVARNPRKVGVMRSYEAA